MAEPFLRRLLLVGSFHFGAELHAGFIKTGCTGAKKISRSSRKCLLFAT